jgi:hypothetical protein
MAGASTSYVEHQSLTMRMSMRRFTRLTNAFSKMVANHAAAVAVHFMHYNFCRPHLSLYGRTPAQTAGVSSRRWAVEELIRLLEEAQSRFCHSAESVPTAGGILRRCPSNPLQTRPKSTTRTRGGHPCRQEVQGTGSGKPMT